MHVIKIKAFKFHKRNCFQKISYFPIKIYYIYIVILGNNSTTNNRKKLNHLVIKTVSNPSKSIQNIIDNKNTNIKSDEVFYSMQCLDYKKYVRETSLSTQKRIYGHKRYLKICDKKNTLVRHNLEINYNFNFKDSKLLVIYIIKNSERLLKLALFQFTVVLNKDPVFFILSSNFVKLVLKIIIFLI